MERLSYAPLVAHLQEQHQLYNQLYTEAELKYGPLDGRILHEWIVQEIQPIVMLLHQANPDRLPAVFTALYRELLRLTGCGWIISYKAEYHSLWKLCAKMPSIVNGAPQQVLNSLTHALHTVRRLQPGSTGKWITMMESTVPACHTPGELQVCGRMIAWLCGLAQLREKCRQEFQQLAPAVKEALQLYASLPVPLEKIFTGNWFNKTGVTFIDAPGGFTGLGGTFTQPPILRLAGAQVMAMDNENAFLLFADEFGRVLWRVNNSGVPASPDLSALKTFESGFGSIEVPLNDISSCILANDTLFFTRHSSHHIFIYGWSNTH